MISWAVLRQTKGLGSSFQCSARSSIASVSASTLAMQRGHLDRAAAPTAGRIAGSMGGDYRPVSPEWAAWLVPQPVPAASHAAGLSPPA